MLLYKLTNVHVDEPHQGDTKPIGWHGTGWEKYLMKWDGYYVSC